MGQIIHFEKNQEKYYTVIKNVGINTDLSLFFQIT